MYGRYTRVVRQCCSFDQSYHAILQCLLFSTHLEATRIIIPIAGLYTPMKVREKGGIRLCCLFHFALVCPVFDFGYPYCLLQICEGMPSPLLYDPIRCNGCGAILNPYAQVGGSVLGNMKPSIRTIPLWL